jgi:hypothetical protein
LWADSAHDRNVQVGHDQNVQVGGRQSHAAPHADKDSDHGSSSNENESELEPGTCNQVIHTYPSNILSYPRDILLDIHGISFWYPSDILSYPDISCFDIRTSGYFLLH